jgi:predicted cobalt transporter CbtA
MMGRVLLAGMLAGLVAGLVSFGFFRLAGEPSVERAIAFEQALEKATGGAGAAEPELVSRGVQSGFGLLTGVAVYGAALGGLFALGFALAYRRMGDFGPRATAAILAGLGFVSAHLIPALKYPAAPPAIGAAETIGSRTSLYFAFLFLSLAAMIAAGLLRRRLAVPLGGVKAALVAAAAYILVMACLALALPQVSETPEGFPADALWRFRAASLAGQALMWAVLGLTFGEAAERLFARETNPFRAKSR